MIQNLVILLAMMANGLKSCQCAEATGKKYASEERELNALYLESLSEGGKLTVYAGGSLPTDQDAVKRQFEERFPNTTITFIIDSSNVHRSRINYQLETGRVIADVVQLQTLHDFPIWKARGVLHSYRPIGWSQLFDGFKDRDGFYSGIFVFTFSNVVNKLFLNSLPKGFIPREAQDFLRPELANKLALTFPNDDDANLYWLKLIIDKYGWKYLQSLMNQRPVFFRGNGATKMAIDKGDSLTATPCSILLMSNPATSNSTFPLPLTDPFVTFPQTAAILRGTKNLATAKLYLSWRLSYRFQAATPMNFWSVRKDVPPPPGIKPLFEYTKQTDPFTFGKWMSNRAMVEQFRGQVQLFVGDVKGSYPTLDLGLYPTGRA
ncbi:hypothetical protein HA402_001200 [Bradysia odoriphaga]|nr:hypothetical protein HA402_001200 [Bradysia odoriphaga]